MRIKNHANQIGQHQPYFSFKSPSANVAFHSHLQTVTDRVAVLCSMLALKRNTRLLSCPLQRL